MLTPAHFTAFALLLDLVFQRTIELRTISDRVLMDAIRFAIVTSAFYTLSWTESFTMVQFQILVLAATCKKIIHARWSQTIIIY